MAMLPTGPRPLAMATPDVVKVVQVIQVEAYRGAGIEGDPVRIVIQFWSFDGQRLAEHDPLGTITPMETT